MIRESGSLYTYYFKNVCKAYDFGEFSVEIDFHTNREHVLNVVLFLKSYQAKNYSKNSV